MVGAVNGPETPELIPVLSKGKHRSPRRGACFMEYASFLAGERWSDHPACTHHLLAGVARDVNDHMSDPGRNRIVTMIPSVVGLNGDDPAVDVGIAVRCATVALPISANFRQGALAAGILAARQVFAGMGTHIDAGRLWDDARRALRSVPGATSWARSFVTDTPIPAKTFVRRSAPSIVRVSVTGIAEACVPDPDIYLHKLLGEVIRDCTGWFQTESESPGSSIAGLERAVPPHPRDLVGDLGGAHAVGVDLRET
jgi:hypothetical protein